MIQPSPQRRQMSAFKKHIRNRHVPMENDWQHHVPITSKINEEPAPSPKMDINEGDDNTWCFRDLARTKNIQAPPASPHGDSEEPELKTNEFLDNSTSRPLSPYSPAFRRNNAATENRSAFANVDDDPRDSGTDLEKTKRSCVKTIGVEHNHAKQSISVGIGDTLRIGQTLGNGPNEGGRPVSPFLKILQQNIKQKQKKDDKAAVKEPSPSAKKMQDLIMQEIKKTHKNNFRSTLIVFEIEKCKRDIRENDERRRKEDVERRKKDAERRVYEKNQESIAEKKRLNLKRNQKKKRKKILKRKQKQESKRITLARDAAKIEAKAKVATAVAVKKARIEKARVEKARIARLDEKNGLRLEKIRESNKAKDITNKTKDKVKMKKKIEASKELKKEQALEKERKEILFKRRMRTKARKQKRKLDKHERYSKRARIKKMKDKKIKAAAIIVTLFKKVVAGKADKLDAAISEAKAPEKTRSAEARGFKNIKGTVNLRHRRVSEKLVAEKISVSFSIHKFTDQSGSIKDVVLAVAELAVAQCNTCAKVKTYQLDVAQGDTCAAFKLGNVYASGLFNVEKNDEVALIYYMLAASTGHTKAKFIVGVMYATGLGIGKDMNKAQYWWKVAAENGDKDSLIAWMETVF